MVKEKGDPPGLEGVHVCPTAGAFVQSADPPTPGKMKLMSRSGKPGSTSKEINGVLANIVPTGSLEISKLSTVFCPSSPTNDPAAAVVLNMFGVNVGLRSLFHVIIVDVTVTVPLMLNVPEIAEADKVINKPGRITPKNNNPILFMVYRNLSYIFPGPTLANESCL